VTHISLGVRGIRFKLYKTGVSKGTEERITTKPRKKQINKRRKKTQDKVGMDKMEERKRIDLQKVREKE